MLKDGKIFWFKDDLVGPVSSRSAAACPGIGRLTCGTRAPHPPQAGSQQAGTANCPPLPRPPCLPACLVRLQNSQPRGIIEVNRCLSIKGAEDTINKPHAFEISTTDASMFFVADSDKEKEVGAEGGSGCRGRQWVQREAVIAEGGTVLGVVVVRWGQLPGRESL